PRPYCPVAICRYAQVPLLNQPMKLLPPTTTSSAPSPSMSPTARVVVTWLPASITCRTNEYVGAIGPTNCGISPVCWLSAEADPPGPVAVTRTRNVRAASAVATTYVDAVAPEMSAHVPP